MPLNPNQTRQLLENLAHLPNKKLGQNFLIDGNIVRKSLELAELAPGQAVVEIGPGLGTLTRALLESGHPVWAVERDPTLAAYLRNELVSEQTKLHLTEGDCLDFPYAALPETNAAAGYQVVANLPYAVSTPWMDALLTGPLPERMVLMLQKEAGDRYTATHGTKNFGAISIFLQSAYTVAGRHLVSQSCFFPTPKVDSLLLRLDRKPHAVCFDRATREGIRRIFTQRRKQLGRLCRKEDSPSVLHWFESLIEKGYPATARPEDIPGDEWTRLKF